MAKTEDNVRWLQDNQIHVLFNELATEMLAVRPDDVLGFICSWGNKKREARAKGESFSRRPSRQGSEMNATNNTAVEQPTGDNGIEPGTGDGECPMWRPTPDELGSRHPEPSDNYTIGEVIGEGHYGKVYKAVQTLSNATVAVKQITIEGDWVEQEIAHLQHCRSPYVVEILGSHYHRGSDTLWIVMEMLDVSLAAVAEAAGPRAFTEPMIASICREVLHGLDAIHNMQRVHLDVKPGNLLLTPDKRHVKLADFGTMQVIGQNCVQLGDFAFMSPEVAYSSGLFDAGSDIWSFGISCLYFADGEAPMWREKPDLLMFIHRETCMKPSLWEPLRWSREFCDILSYCFLKHPQERPRASSLLRSAWVTNACTTDELFLPPPMPYHENGF
eukprot:TRINITY_DN9041_c0_g1_i2.p1 TRINITY_DN9041_c0_g1~~TRINITY_DN9041_c0_g1_i2.p1  ORF type:complete len:387 (+),score=86.64 TRINITY_DN9041_c0_g1_i2:68-1228(+)